jgi:hypothetical protein
VADQEWSPALGVSRAILSLLWRGAIALVCVAGLLWLLHPTLVWASQYLSLLPGVLVVGVPMMLAGVLLGLLLSARLTEQAGFVGPIVTALAAAALLGALVGGAKVAVALRGSTTWLIGLGCISMAVMAMFTIVKRTWLDAD